VADFVNNVPCQCQQADEVSWLPSSPNVQEVWDCPRRTLSFESDTAHLDVKLLINMHGQLASLLCCGQSHDSFNCLIEILHLLPSML